MAHLTIVTKRSSMSQWPIQRNVYTLVPQLSTAMNRSCPQETTHILTTHNTNTPRLTSAIHPTPPSSAPSSSLPSSTLTPFDDSLTNLSWLHDINILKRTMPTINSSSTSISNKRKEQSSPSSTATTAVYHPNDISDSSDLPVSHELDDDERWRMYKSNPQAKPIYSYSQLILLAMKRSGHEKMTLQMIYEWIVEHFPYFRKMEPTWQNSIRHNLSLNKYFIKVPRTKKEAGTGKGGFWKLSPDYERQRSLLHAQPSSSMNTTQPKRSRPSKRSSTNSSLNQLISDNVTPLMKQSSRMSHENIKLESWIDPILPCIVSKSQSPLHCHTASTVDRCYVRMPSSFLSPTSSPDTQTVSPFHPRHMSDFSAILTPSPSNSPSSMSSKPNFSSTKFDECDMLLLDSSTFDWDAYLCETPNDMDVQPLLTTKTEQDLFNDFNAALTDLTSAAAAAHENTFDAFDYANKSGSFHSLFDDDDHHPQQESSLVQSSSTSLAVKGAGIKRPLWWMNNETNSSTTKLPSLETAFDLKLPK